MREDMLEIANSNNKCLGLLCNLAIIILIVLMAGVGVITAQLHELKALHRAPPAPEAKP